MSARLCHTQDMPKRSSKGRDVVELAASIVRQVTETPRRGEEKKNPHAVALGRLGGLKGGRARAEKLSPARRKKIAENAAKARWEREAGGQ